jgi:uncharacterized membrane protein
MTEEQSQVQHLQQKLADLQKRQELFHIEIQQIKAEIDELKKMQEAPATGVEMIPTKDLDIKPSEPAKSPEEKSIPKQTVEARQTEVPPVSKTNIPVEKRESELERFIGENLINKIGIAITIIGVAIGAKYAIDHDLISPLTRIILGYLVGFGLLFFAVRLKKQFENFSAVLLSGSMAIIYFITYAAFSYYSLFSLPVAYFIMVIITIFTVAAALNYNKEIIAVIGLVGAYAIPFLLNEGPEKVAILFTYTAIINVGILVVAVKKYWKSLYFSSFGFTWLIYFSWYFKGYQSGEHFALALSFLFVFFMTFYLTFLSYKLIRKEKFDIFDILLLLLNSFIFYGLGYTILKHHQPGENLKGLFTLGNAIVHLIVSAVIYRNKLADRNMFYFVSGLALVFITIAIPVQLNGNWVTLLWICEATLLFYIGRTRNAPVYEYISFPLIVLAFFSLIQDWGSIQSEISNKTTLHEFTPLFNIQFLTSLIFIAGFALIIRLYYSKKYSDPLIAVRPSLQGLINYALVGLFIFVVYLTFSNEISTYWNHLLTASKIEIPGNGLRSTFILHQDLNNYKIVSVISYSLLFFAVLLYIITRYTMDRYLGIAVFWLSVFTMFIFLLQGLYTLSEMRENYINQYQAEYYPVSSFNLGIRYICFVFAALSLTSLNLWIRRETVRDQYYTIAYSLLFHVSIIWVLSSEILNIMDILKNTHSYKFGLSILWGVYALFLIVLGITGKKQYLRIAGMVLFGITLVKLFFYDISNLDTILKTILFLSLGILMLIVSFLYIKYKKQIFGEPEE